MRQIYISISKISVMVSVILLAPNLTLAKAQSKLNKGTKEAKINYLPREFHFQSLNNLKFQIPKLGDYEISGLREDADRILIVLYSQSALNEYSKTRPNKKMVEETIEIPRALMSSLPATANVKVTAKSLKYIVREPENSTSLNNIEIIFYKDKQLARSMKVNLYMADELRLEKGWRDKFLLELVNSIEIH